MLTIAEVKKALNFVWGKERDLNETYSFDFGSWSCARSNAAETKRCLETLRHRPRGQKQAKRLRAA